MKAPLSWLREFANVPADASAVAAALGHVGFAVESIDGETIDFEITANRPDAMSVIGLAREAAAAFGTPLVEPPYHLRAAAGARIPIAIDADACGRYALAVADVRVAASPAWLADRLTAAGVRPINNVVDVTNYVLLEMGQPMHAFDAAKLAGPEIRVRLARDGERLTTLDGQTRALARGTLVIADRDRVVAIAGVMGGAATEVSGATTRIALESAWFAPAAVRTASRALTLKTEASMRFERGADIDAPVRGLARALALLEKIGAGQAAGPVVDVYPRPAVPRSVVVTRERIARLLGDRIPDADVERILTSLGFALTPQPDGWRAQVPTFRVDVAREADLIEEVGRHWGFDRIPARFPPLRRAPEHASGAMARARLLRRVLSGAGLQEACTFTFIERASAAPFAADEDALVEIANPLSEKFAVLRPTILAGLLDALVYNRHRETADVGLFESGSVFSTLGERAEVAWILTGAVGAHWSGTGHQADFFDATGVAALIASAFRLGEIDARADNDAPAWAVAGRAASLYIGNSTVRIGGVGQMRPDLVAARGLTATGAIVAGVMDASALWPGGEPAPARIAALPRFPSIVRDLSLIVDERLPAAAVRGTIRSHAPATLVGVREFDRYRGKGVPDGHVSLSFRLMFRDADRTLTDSEVQQAVDEIVATLAREHGATLRGAAGQSAE